MNTRVWKSWFIVELYKEIPALFSIFKKMLDTRFFPPSFNFQCQRAKRQKNFTNKSIVFNTIYQKNGIAIVTPAPTV